MARMNTISDGQPFTYELLNNIIENLNALKEPEEGDEEFIEIDGTGKNEKRKPKIIFNRTDDIIPANQTSVDNTVKFTSNFENDNPVVVATLIDPEKGGNIPVGYVVITGVTNHNFSYRIKLIRKREKSTSVRLNYIAFGYTSK